MKEKTVFSFLILASSLLFLPIVNAGECVELKYDDGFWDNVLLLFVGEQVGVRFSLPEKWTTATLVMARFYISANPASIEVHVYDLGNNDLIQPITVTPQTTGWFDVPLNVNVEGDFFIALEYTEHTIPHIGVDQSSNQGRTYNRGSSTDPWGPKPWNIAIRAVVCEPPVGGEILPFNLIEALPKYWVFVLLLLLPAFVILYKKRDLRARKAWNPLVK